MDSINNIEGRFSRRVGERYPDPTYASGFDVDPRRQVTNVVDAVCWVLAIPALVWLAWAVLAV